MFYDEGNDALGANGLWPQFIDRSRKCGGVLAKRREFVLQKSRMSRGFVEGLLMRSPEIWMKFRRVGCMSRVHIIVRCVMG